jgi:hypothetical protein
VRGVGAGVMLVEKTLSREIRKNKIASGCPTQTTFSVFLDIFYPPNFGYFEENGVLNTHACSRQLSTRNMFINSNTFPSARAVRQLIQTLKHLRM